MDNVIKCHFNLFQEGRKYTGHHRNYVLENARSVCYADPTREGLRLREKLGYLGHGRREMAGKVAIAEVEKVKMPDGSFMVLENIPSNVTVFFEINDKGDVEHHQELLLENAPGKIVQGLNANKVGGFSWAMGGRDGGAHGVTRVSGFEGFDYVMNPGFSANRGYVLESADARDMVLESICQAGMDDNAAELIMENWIRSAVFQADELAERLADAEVFESAQAEKIEGLQDQVAGLEADVQAAGDRENARREIITEGAGKSRIVVPDEVAEAMISMASESDFGKVVAFFESAARIDLKRYPLGQEQETLRVGPHMANKQPEYGQAAAAIDFQTPTFTPRG